MKYLELPVSFFFISQRTAPMVKAKGVPTVFGFLGNVYFVNGESNSRIKGYGKNKKGYPMKIRIVANAKK